MQQITLNQLMDAEPPPFTPDIVKVCQDRDCGISFITSDPDRKYCDACLAERINGAGIFEDDDEDESLIEKFAAEDYARDNPSITGSIGIQVAAAFSVPIDDAPGLFDQPPPIRPERRARVICLVCGHEARIPILRDGKVCDTCLADLAGQRARVEADMEIAVDRSYNADLDLYTAISDASDEDCQRYNTALELKAANDPRIKDAWRNALAVGDGLARLLAADDAQRAAEQVLVTALNEGQVVLQEIAKVTT